MYRSNPFFKRKVSCWIRGEKKRLTQGFEIEDYPGAREIESEGVTTHRRMEREESGRLRQLVSELQLDLSLRK